MTRYQFILIILFIAIASFINGAISRVHQRHIIAIVCQQQHVPRCP